MAKFKQVSTGLTLVCEREDVIKQYEKYPDLYIPLDEPKVVKSAPKTEEKSAEKAETKSPEKK